MGPIRYWAGEGTVTGSVFVVSLERVMARCLSLSVRPFPPGVFFLIITLFFTDIARERVPREKQPLASFITRVIVLPVHQGPCCLGVNGGFINSAN